MSSSSGEATLLTPEYLPFTTGTAPYYDSAKPDSVPREPRIYILIEPANLGIAALAMVDTGAPWCILEPWIGELIKDHVEELPKDVSLNTQLGLFSGKLYNGGLTLLAEEGEALEMEVTFFLCPDWPGGNFVGYLGFLDRLRFAIDPQVNKFFFGPLG